MTTRSASEDAPRLLAFWRRHRRTILLCTFALLLAIAAVWLGRSFWRLVEQPSPEGAIDLRLRRREVLSWFTGKVVYGRISDAVYPPASYLMLWPFVAVFSFPISRLVWALMTVCVLAALASLLGRWSRAETREERRLLALSMLAAYPVGATISNGQLGIFVLFCLTVSLTLLARAERTLRRDLAITGLFLVALVKPSLSAHFFWLLLFLRGGLRPAIMVVVGYALLTVAAASFQDRGPVTLMRTWVDRGVAGSTWGATQGHGRIQLEDASGADAGKGGQGAGRQGQGAGKQNQGAGKQERERVLRIHNINLHSVLTSLGLRQWMTRGSVLALLLLGAWVWHNRGAPLWSVMGVTALVSRFSGYHAWYDDVLVLIPLVALFRLTRVDEGRPQRSRTTAGLLFTAMVASLLAPGGVYSLPHPWSNGYVVLQAALWLFVLGYLALHCARERHSSHSSS